MRCLTYMIYCVWTTIIILHSLLWQGSAFSQGSLHQPLGPKKVRRKIRNVRPDTTTEDVGIWLFRLVLYLPYMQLLKALPCRLLVSAT